MSVACGRVVSRREDVMLARVETEEELKRLLRFLDARGGTLMSVAPARESLEDLLIRESRGADPERPADVREREAQNVR